MNTADALYEYMRTEIVPMIAGESELTGAIINGALRAGRKKITGKLAENGTLHALGLVKPNGEADPDMFKEFADGVFDGREKLTLSIADMLKYATGIELHSELLQSKLHFTRADADSFLSLLRQ
jgi:hypothetical protein